MLNEKHQWVAIYTSPRAEKRTASRLQQLGIETYFPIQIKLHRWSDRWKNVEVPLLPSYIFAKISSKEVIPVRGTEGVSHIVSWHGKPAIIPEKEVMSIRRLVDADIELHVRNSTLMKPGTKVRIIEGPFSGMEGTLLEDCEDGNFSICISGLNVALVTTIEQSLLQPVDDKEKGLWGE